MQRRPVEAPNQGILHLTLRRTGHRTVIQDAYTHVPLQVLRPIYPDDTGTAHLYLLNPCGGVVGGDTYTITATLEAGAQAYITTPSATKLYATQDVPATQHIAFDLARHAVLTYLPQQTIPFANSAFRQQLTLRIAPGAHAFVGEIVAPGRVAQGELFAYREYSSQLRVEQPDGAIRLIEHTRLIPQQQALHSLGFFEGHRYVGVFYTFHGDPTESGPLAERLHACLDNRNRLIGSATILAHGGLAVRLLAMDHSSASQALHDVWNTTYQHLLGDPAPPRRMA